MIKECAKNEQCMDIINDPEHTNDGVRLVWSLLKHPSDVIKRNSCLALVTCIKHAKDSPEMVRAFVGGLELTVSLLESTNTEVLSAVCATIAEIATDPENLGILSDLGVVEKLANLVITVIFGIFFFLLEESLSNDFFRFLRNSFKRAVFLFLKYFQVSSLNKLHFASF